MAETVCAIVVTYNRKNLLQECLEGLRKQTHPVDAIYILDNASTDGTPQMLLEQCYIRELPPAKPSEPWESECEIPNLQNGKPIKIHCVRMHKNTGGAGGFYEGIKRAYEKGYDWFWLMDDDTVPLDSALFELQNAKEKVDAQKIGFICSKVLWIDGTPHLMNIPQIKPLVNCTPFNYYEDQDLLLVEAASFVSLLVPKTVVQKVGLPLKDFFLWSDDLEFTQRITLNQLYGFYCRRSLVLHKTPRNYSAFKATDHRIYYRIRNSLYLTKKKSKVRFLFRVFYQLWNIRVLPPGLRARAIKACLDALFFNPKVEYPVSDKEKKQC